MSSQLENGYTKIADTILEKVAQTKLNGTQFRILMIVWRSTYGWNKKEHELSLNYLVKATNINKRQLQRELNEMIKIDILTEVKAPSFNTSRIIAFNKNYIISTEVAKKTPGDELDTSTDGELDTSTGDGLDVQKRDIKKHYKDASKVTDYYRYICYNFSQPRRITEARIKSINARIKDYNLELVLTALESVSESKFLNESIKSNWLNIDWIFNPNNFVKIIENKYNTKKEQPKKIYKKPMELDWDSVVD